MTTPSLNGYHTHLDLVARAFNLGSDARMAGVLLCENPYDSTDKPYCKIWRDGWRDTDLFWGDEGRALQAQGKLLGLVIRELPYVSAAR